MSRVEVPMPQMGESIAEGTVSKWLKQVGDTVERDEPILEISTDKVDAEIPSPSAGTLVEVVVQEGETVEVGTVVAYIDTEGGAAVTESSVPEAKAPDDKQAWEKKQETTSQAPESAAEAESRQGASPHQEAESAEERLRQRSTPVVRKIAQEHGVDLTSVEGTGHAGRVTKQDILGYIDGVGSSEATTTPPAQAPSVPAASPVKPPVAAPSAAPAHFWKTFYGGVEHPEFPVRQGDSVEPMDKIRRLTAEHMVVAKRVASHVHSFIEIDFTGIDRIRAANKQRWTEQGAKVSYTTFVVWACSRLLREHPTLNSTVSGNNIITRGSVNVGMAVDLDPGLIVPVIHDTDELSLVGIGKRMLDLAERARSRKLGPAEIQGATFSITNPGVLGTLVGMPIIPKGTSAILGTGAIEKKVVVVTDPGTGGDSMAIRKRSLFSLGYDHRLVDGADAARFLADLKALLQDFPEDA